ncbi:phosphotransferase [Mycolicibacterium sp. S2-37]|nr:phosphotransferase [Mycolicibacterium sp. S2-37]
MAGGITGLRFPAHAEALIDGGARFLTEAFRAWGALGGDNKVTGIGRADEWPGGSTGRKLALSVSYADADARLPERLFVKFSRDFDDPVRDHGRSQMASEVHFATLARAVELPVTVPVTLFADYDDASGTGVLITERIPFGANGIEPHHPKCLDDALPDAPGHYRALLSAVARLAGADRAGRFPADLTAHFPTDMTAASVGERPRVTPQRAERQVARYADFAATQPALLPESIRSPQFLRRLAAEAPRLAVREADVWRFLSSRPELIALCHWNANVDNAWFWRQTDGGLGCGLLDWGCAGRMNVAMAIWGALSGARNELWDNHFDELVAVFTDEFQRAGGPRVDPRELTDHVVLYAAIMGVTWLLGAPAFLSSRLPDPVAGRHAPAVRDHEPVRAQLQMLVNVLDIWWTHDLAGTIDRCLGPTTPTETPIVPN